MNICPCCGKAPYACQCIFELQAFENDERVIWCALHQRLVRRFEPERDPQGAPIRPANRQQPIDRTTQQPLAWLGNETKDTKVLF